MDEPDKPQRDSPLAEVIKFLLELAEKAKKEPEKTTEEEKIETKPTETREDGVA